MKSQTDARQDLGSCVKAVARSSLLLTCLLTTALPGIAAQASAQFDVMIRLLSAERAPQTGLCDSSLATTVATSPTVVCGFVPNPGLVVGTRPPSSAPAQASSFPPKLGAPTDPTSRPEAGGGGFLPGPGLLVNAPARPRAVYEGSGFRYISYITGLAGSVDIYTAAGTSTVFRLVNWADREYIEMTVGW